MLRYAGPAVKVESERGTLSRAELPLDGHPALHCASARALVSPNVCAHAHESNPAGAALNGGVHAVQHHLQHEALHFQHEKQAEIRVGLVNIISDSITLVTFLITLAARNEGRELLTNTIGRITQVRRPPHR